MTYAEKIAWLKRYQAALRREKLLRDELQAQHDRAISNSKILGGVPGGAQDGQSLPRAVESILQAEQELQCQINICGAIRREVVAAIGRVPDDLDQDILRQRYVIGKKWWQIAANLPMAESRVRFRAHSAVEMLEVE